MKVGDSLVSFVVYLFVVQMASIEFGAWAVAVLIATFLAGWAMNLWEAKHARKR